MVGGDPADGVREGVEAAGSPAKFLALTIRLDKPVENSGGTLNMLRNGVHHFGGSRSKIAQLRRRSKATNAHYAGMRVRAMRQAHFSTADRSINLVLFVNGLPVATVG